jgi:hypothetical protein
VTTDTPIRPTSCCFPSDRVGETFSDTRPCISILKQTHKYGYGYENRQFFNFLSLLICSTKASFIWPKSAKIFCIVTDITKRSLTNDPTFVFLTQNKNEKPFALLVE